MSPDTLILDWATLHQDALALAELAGTKGEWQGVVAVARGGLIPAAIVARALGLRVVETLCVATYEGRRRGESRVLKGAPAAGDGTGFLVIDDLVDSGATARAVREALPQGHFACVYAKPEGMAGADSWVRTVAQGIWVAFPWEGEEV